VRVVRVSDRQVVHGRMDLVDNVQKCQKLLAKEKTECIVLVGRFGNGDVIDRRLHWTYEDAWMKRRRKSFARACRV
jgi:hypothetical protein